MDRLVAREGYTLLLKVSVACADEVEISYTLPTPYSPDVEIRSDAKISVEFLRAEGRITDADGRRKLVSGRRLEIEAAVGLKDMGRGLHWLSVRFPSGTPSVEVSLPLVVV